MRMSEFLKKEGVYEAFVSEIEHRGLVAEVIDGYDIVAVAPKDSYEFKLMTEYKRSIECTH